MPTKRTVNSLEILLGISPSVVGRQTLVFFMGLGRYLFFAYCCLNEKKRKAVLDFVSSFDLEVTDPEIKSVILFLMQLGCFLYKSCQVKQYALFICFFMALVTFW